MKNNIYLLAILFLSSIGVLNAQSPEIISGQYVITLKESAAKPILSNATTRDNGDLQVSASSAARTQNISKIKSIYDKSGVAKAKVVHEFSDASVGFSAKLTNDEVEKIKKNPEVAGVYQDYKISLDAGSSASAGASDLTTAASGQTLPCGISKAGGPVDGSTKSTWIWVFDTGIEFTHPDLNVQTNPIYAKSFIAGQTANDGNGHGTFVAGVAAAKNNNIGTVGVSAGAKVVPVKVLSNAGSGSFSSIIAGLNHVMTYSIPGDIVIFAFSAYPIANCENSNPIMRDLIRALGNKGVWVIMPAGAGGGNANQVTPGCINGTRVLTVGCISCTNQCCSFGGFGKPAVDFVAVGTNVYSTYINGGYTTWSSSVAPVAVVAGICHQQPGVGPVSAGNVVCGGLSYLIARR